MGPSASGKTTVGTALAAALGWPFYEGDDFHPQENVARMRAGAALTDQDRAPWLEALAEVVQSHAEKGSAAVIACSALKHSYRDRLVPTAEAAKAVRFVYLDVPSDVLAARLERRRSHFFAATLLDSQLDALEVPGSGEPAPVLRVDATQPVEALVGAIRTALGT